MAQKSINFLPEEMLIQIFQLLTPKDLKNVTLVCKQWREIGEDPSLWTWAVVTVETREEIQKLKIHRLQRVENVRVTCQFRDLYVYDYWEAEDLVELFEVLLPLPSVTSIIGLEYTSLSGVDSDLLANVFNKLSEFRILCGQGENVFVAIAKQTNLKRLYVYESCYIRLALFADAISNVEHVHLIDFGNMIEPEQIKALFALITQDDRCLKKLYLTCCETDELMPELFGAALNMLEKVRLEDMIVTKEQMTAVLSKVVDGESKLEELIFQDLVNEGVVVGLDPTLVRRAWEKIGVFFSEVEFLV